MATILTQTAAPAAVPRRRIWRNLARNPIGLVGLVMLVLVVGMAVFAPLIAPYDPSKPVRATIDTIYAPPSAEHLLGTDDGGKDVLSLFIYGARVSLFIGFTGALLTVAIGGTIGLLAGYYGGRVGALLMRVTDTFLVIPDLPLYVVLVAFLGASIWNIILAIAVIGWTSTARVVYSQTISVKERMFVT